jgi:hypothetical protein
MDAKRILIVANRTAGGAHVKKIVRARLAAGPCRFTVLAPATPPPGGLTWTRAEAVALAEWRLRGALEGLREIGADADGIVGAALPMDAIAAAVASRRYDEIVVSTLPPGLSRWLRQGLPHDVHRTFGIPVTHLTSDAGLLEDPLERVQHHLGVA